MDGITEVKDLVVQQGKAWEEFKASNDLRLKEIEKRGNGDPLITEKLEKLNGELNTLGDLKQTVEQIQKASARYAGMPAAGGDGISVDLRSLSNQVQHFAKMAQRGMQVHGHFKYFSEKGETAPEVRAAYDAMLRKGHEHLAPEQLKALTTQTDPDGGYLVRPELAAEMVRTVFETSPIRQVASIVTIGTDSIEILVDKDEAGYEWGTEESTPSTTTTPQFAKIKIDVHEMRAKPKATQKMLEDVQVDVESWLAMKVAERFTRAENAAFVTGDGVGKPKGITAYTTVADASWSWGNVGFIATGSSGAWPASNPADKLLDLFYSLKDEYAANATWLMRREQVNEVRQFKEATTNAYIWQPGLQLGEPDRLLGAPLLRAQDMPAKGANSLSVAIGDFRRAYQIVDRLGITVLRDPYSAKPYIEFYTRRRVGGGIINFEALKLLKFA